MMEKTLLMPTIILENYEDPNPRFLRQNRETSESKQDKHGTIVHKGGFTNYTKQKVSFPNQLTDCKRFLG